MRDYCYRILREFIFYMKGIIIKYDSPEIEYLIKGLNDFELVEENYN